MPEKTKGGIYLPQDKVQDGIAKINIGRVEAAGPGITLRNGESVQVSVKPGDVVVWEQFGSLRFEILGPRIVCIRSEDLGAVLEKGEYDDGWFEDYEDGESPEEKKLSEIRATQQERTNAEYKNVRENVCACEIECQECGNKETVDLPWINANLGSVDDSSIKICPTCNKDSRKVMKKLDINLQVTNLTPTFHRRG